MKSILVKNAYGLENVTIEEKSIPNITAKQILVKVGAISFNQLDLMVAKGAFGTSLPHTLGSDVAGTVEKIGQDVTLFKVGDTVTTHFIQSWQSGPLQESYSQSSLGTTNEGVFAEYIALDETSFVKAPVNLSIDEASTLPIAALTAWEALVNTAKLKAGETLLLKGTGGVSVFALQFAKIMGAKVIITSSSDEKLHKAKLLGADLLINYKTNTDWEQKVLELTEGKGANLALETAWSDIDKTISAMCIGGQIVTVGLLGGHEATISYFSLIQKQITINGIQVGSKLSFEEMNKAIEINQLKPVIDKIFTINELDEALAYLDEGKHFGKIVLKF
jgi:NADPH:quinone reductase-like Zn-dependent oxidoreductase